MIKALLLWAVASTAQAITYLPHTATLNEDATEFSVDGASFTTVAHLNEDGEKVELTENESFSQSESNAWVRYGFTGQLELSAGLRFRTNTATYDDGGTAETLTATGTDAYMFRLRYSFARKEGTQWSVEGNYSQTMYANSLIDDEDFADELVLGDDGQCVSAGFGVSHQTEANNFFSGRMRFRSPSRDLSGEIVSEGEIGIPWEYFAVYGGVENVTSLQQDPYTEDPEEKPLMNTMSTGLYNTVNRSWTAPYGGVILGLGSTWRLEYRMTNTMTGTSTDTGVRHMVTLARRTGGADDFKQINSAFKEYTVEANITKVSKSKTSVVLDAGVAGGLQEGMKVDFYHFDYLGGNELIASGFVIKAGANKAMVKVTRRFSKTKITTSSVARSGLISE